MHFHRLAEQKSNVSFMFCLGWYRIVTALPRMSIDCHGLPWCHQRRPTLPCTRGAGHYEWTHTCWGLRRFSVFIYSPLFRFPRTRQIWDMHLSNTYKFVVQLFTHDTKTLKVTMLTTTWIIVPRETGKRWYTLNQAHSDSITSLAFFITSGFKERIQQWLWVCLRTGSTFTRPVIGVVMFRKYTNLQIFCYRRKIVCTSANGEGI